MKLKGVIFDMDGLLLDTEMIYLKASHWAAKQLNLPFSKEMYMRYLGTSDEETKAGYLREFADYPKESVMAFIQLAFTEARRLFQEEVVPVKAGVNELLDLLDTKGIKKVVASSNNRETVLLLLQKNQLLNRFDGIVTGDDVAFAKPHPEIVEKAVQLMKTIPAETMMLEDSLNGIKASAAAGVPVVMIPDLLPPVKEAQELAQDILPGLSAFSEKYLA